MKTIKSFKRNKKKYRVKLSRHANKRMCQRQVTKKTILNNIFSLKNHEIEYLSRNTLKAIILDKDEGVSVVIGFNKPYELTVITVINQEKICSKPTTVEFII